MFRAVIMIVKLVMAVGSLWSTVAAFLAARRLVKQGEQTQAAADKDAVAASVDRQTKAVAQAPSSDAEVSQAFRDGTA